MRGVVTLQQLIQQKHSALGFLVPLAIFGKFFSLKRDLEQRQKERKL